MEIGAETGGISDRAHPPASFGDAGASVGMKRSKLRRTAAGMEIGAETGGISDRGGPVRRSGTGCPAAAILRRCNC
jgi:hypothetical protein